jgi:hypothetical protein
MSDSWLDYNKAIVHESKRSLIMPPVITLEGLKILGKLKLHGITRLMA